MNLEHVAAFDGMLDLSGEPKSLDNKSINNRKLDRVLPHVSESYATHCCGYSGVYLHDLDSLPI